MDAWVFGDRDAGPEDAYKYFKGETVKHPSGYDIKIDTPLDFAGVTDHSEYVGVVKFANDPTSPVSKLPAAAPLILKNNSAEAMQSVFLAAVKLLTGKPDKALMDPKIARTVWEKTSKSPTRPTNQASSPPSAAMSGRPCRTT